MVDKKEETKASETTVDFDLEVCNRCMACVANCPTKCLEEVNGNPVQTKPEECIKCGTCEATCPVEAVKLKR